MLGVVTAMETFCGQAHGARRYAVVGVVFQRALAIALAYCAGALLLWTRGATLLARMGQDPQIAALAGRFTVALGPALVLDAADQCCRRYLSAQAVVRPLMVVTLIATLLTPFYLYLFVFHYGLGLIGAAVAWDLTQATSLALMAACCVRHTRRQPPARCTWAGWTREAFEGWGQYITMAAPSMVMICEQHDGGRMMGAHERVCFGRSGGKAGEKGGACFVLFCCAGPKGGGAESTSCQQHPLHHLWSQHNHHYNDNLLHQSIKRPRLVDV